MKITTNKMKNIDEDIVDKLLTESTKIYINNFNKLIDEKAFGTKVTNIVFYLLNISSSITLINFMKMYENSSHTENEIIETFDDYFIILRRNLIKLLKDTKKFNKETE
jgi:hypothetical protein